MILNTVSQEQLKVNLSANTISVPVSSWVSDSTNASYPFKALITSSLYTDDFIPQYVDLIPANGTAFFSEGETAAKGILNPNVVINSSGIILYATEKPTVELTFRIGGI